MGRYDIVNATIEEAADRAASNHGLDSGAFRRGKGSIYEGSGWNDGRVKEAWDQIQAERAQGAQKNMVTDLNQQKEGMINQNADSSRGQLAQNMAGIKQSANSRGLLYSGIKQGQEAGAQSEAASNQAGYRAALNASTDKSTEDIMAGKATMGLDQYQQDVTNAGNAYQQALEKRKQSGGILGAIGGAIGAGAGLLMGGPGGAAVGAQAGKALF